jgi:hypothetical protein
MKVRGLGDCAGGCVGGEGQWRGTEGQPKDLDAGEIQGEGGPASRGTFELLGRPEVAVRGSYPRASGSPGHGRHGMDTAMDVSWIRTPADGIHCVCPPGRPRFSCRAFIRDNAPSPPFVCKVQARPQAPPRRGFKTATVDRYRRLWRAVIGPFLGVVVKIRWSRDYLQGDGMQAAARTGHLDTSSAFWFWC